MRTRLKLCLFILVAFLGLFRLGNTCFWEDEAYNAIFARNFLAHGEFTGWDGRNLLAFRYCTLLDEHLRSVNPPLPSLLAAAGFAALGTDTVAGRIPFALCGLLTVPALYFLTRRAVPELRGAPVYAATALGFSVSFLLFIRQCCYYAPAILFGCLLVLAYQEAIHRKSRAWTLAIAVPAVLLFYTHYLIAAAALGALAVTFLAFDARAIDRRQWFYLAAAAGLFASLTLPYAFAKQIWVRRDFVPHENWLGQKLELIGWSFRDYSTANWFPWMLAAAGLLCFFLRGRPRSVEPGIGRLIAFAAVSTIGIALLSPQHTPGATYADIRYQVAVMPVLAALAGIVLAAVHRQKPACAVALLLLTINTNLLSFAPFEFSSRPQPLLPAYLREIARPYPESVRAVSDYVLSKIEKDAVVMTYSIDRYGWPVMFYTGHHVIFGGMLDRVAASRLHPDFPWARIDALGVPVFGTVRLPDYFIAFGATQETTTMIGAMLNYHRNVHGLPSTEGYELVDTIDVYYTRTTRPEVFWHKFAPVTGFDPDSEAVYVFKRASRTGPALSAQRPVAAPAASASAAAPAPAAAPAAAEKTPNILAETPGLGKDSR